MYPSARRSIGLGVILGLLAFGAFTLLRAPCLGVADNLDYWRVMRPAGVEHLEPAIEPGRFVECRFATSESRLRTGLSSPAMLAWGAKHLTWGLADEPDRMDLRQVGLLYLLVAAALVVAGVWWRAPPLLVAAWTYVLVDPGYLLFFNSFYADPAVLVALLGIGLWLVGWENILKGRVDRGWRTGRLATLVVLVVLGGASKMQYVLLPAIATVAVGSLAPLRRRAGEDLAMRRSSIYRLLLLTSMLVLVAVAVPWHFLRGPAPRFLEVNNYHAVYAGLLQVTGEPDRALRSLGVPIEYRGLPRRDVWSAELPADHPVHEHLRDLSRWRLLALYLADPEAIGATADRIDRSLSAVETHRRGNFPRDLGRRKGAQYTVPWQFSRLRGLVFGSWPAAVWLLLGLAAVWLVISALRGWWGGARLVVFFWLSSRRVKSPW